MVEDKNLEALRSLYRSNQNIYRDIMEETARHKIDKIDVTIEHFNNWLELILDQKQYTNEEITNSISAIWLFELGKELQWIIFALLSGFYFEVLRTLRFVFESTVRAHFLDEWLDKEVTERGMAEQGASINLKLEILHLMDKLRDVSREKDFMEGNSQNIFDEVIDEFFDSCSPTRHNKQLKTLYKGIISKYKKQLTPFGGKRGLISQLPENIFSKSDKNDLNNFYGLLSKYSHLSSYVLDFFLDDPSQIFTPSFNDELFDKCTQLLTSVMDVFLTIVLLHFERLRVTKWLSLSVQDLQMPLSQKMIEKRKKANPY
jgi:hypothetical protein